MEPGRVFRCIEELAELGDRVVGGDGSCGARSRKEGGDVEAREGGGVVAVAFAAAEFGWD
jgi:hypothetical protein